MFQIKYVYDLVDKISPQLKKIQSNLKNTANHVKTSSRSMARSFEKVGHKLVDIGKKAGQVGRNLFIKTTLPLALLGASFIKAASSYQEALTKSEVVFGKYSKGVIKFSDTAFKQFGLGQKDALELASFFGQMGKSMELPIDKVAHMSKALVGFAGDIASFQDKSVEQVKTGLKGIFTGETTSIIELGVVMTEVNLQAFALSKGINKKIKSFTQAEKVMLRYAFVMEKLRDARGDFIRTNDGFANSLRSLTAKFQNLSVRIGFILIPYALKLVNIFSRLIDKFDALSPGTQKFILIALGIVAVLAPLLMIIGFVASGITALIAAFTFIAPLIGIVAGAFVALGVAMMLNPLGLFIAGTLAIIHYWKEIVSLFEKVVKFFSKFNIFNGMDSVPFIDKMKVRLSGEGMTGVDYKAMAQSAYAAVGKFGDGVGNYFKDRFATGINKDQKLTAGGELRIINENAPKGTKTNFVPVKNSILNTYTNTTYAGS